MPQLLLLSVLRQLVLNVALLVAGCSSISFPAASYQCRFAVAVAVASSTSAVLLLPPTTDYIRGFSLRGPAAGVHITCISPASVLKSSSPRTSYRFIYTDVTVTGYMFVLFYIFLYLVNFFFKV